MDISMCTHTHTCTDVHMVYTHTQAYAQTPSLLPQLGPIVIEFISPRRSLCIRENARACTHTPVLCPSPFCTKSRWLHPVFPTEMKGTGQRMRNKGWELIERWRRDRRAGEFAEMALSSNLHLSHQIIIKWDEQWNRKSEGRQRIDKSQREREREGESDN